MVFKKFVEVGRVIIINYGPLTGKLAVIVDILTTTKVIVQGLKGGVKRQELSLRRVTLTDYKIDIKWSAKREEVFKAIEDYKLEEKFKKSIYSKKKRWRLGKELGVRTKSRWMCKWEITPYNPIPVPYFFI